MNFKYRLGCSFALLAGFLIGGFVPGAQADEVAEFSAPLNVEYQRPDTDYGNYSRLMILGLDVSQTRIVPPPWETGKPFKWDVSDKNVGKLQREFRESMVEQISGNDGYEIVTEPGDGVLELYVRIVSFMPYAERGEKSTTKGSGEMRIHAETRDARTGELLGIFAGAQEVGKDYQPNTDFTREQNLKKLFDSWGRRLRIVMDEDHGR